MLRFNAANTTDRNRHGSFEINPDNTDYVQNSKSREWPVGRANQQRGEPVESRILDTDA